MSARTHDLKVWPEYFAAVLSGAKTYELRVNDRGFQVGDALRLREWDPTVLAGQVGWSMCRRGYTGRECERVVSFMTRGGDFGLNDELCVLALAPVAP